MREYIKTVKLFGNLKIGTDYVFENVRGEYQYDFYSNKDMKGTFEIKRLTADFLNDFPSLKSFIFSGHGITINGNVTGWSFGGEVETITFKIEDFITKILWEDAPPRKMDILYFIPYINLLARKIHSKWNSDDDYLIKFGSDEFKLKAKNISVVFYESVSLISYKTPDSIFHRMLYPKIEIDLTDDMDINSILNEYKEFMEEVVLVLSFLLFHRFNIYGYEAKIYDKENNIIQDIDYRYTKKKSGIDCIFKDNIEFNKYFNGDNVSKLIESFIALDNDKKQNFSRLIYSILTIKDLEIFEPKFKDTFYVLEAISKLIVKPDGNISTEELIAKACEIAKVPLNSINFLPSVKSKKLKLLISEYRNELTHFNNDIDIDFEKMIPEFNKIMNLIRKLMIFYLVPELKEFPYPENKYKL